MKKFLMSVTILAMALCLSLSPVPVQAEIIIDFSGLLEGGTISYAGGAAPMVGADLPIDFVIGTNTPSNPGIHTVTSGLLNFSTGNFSSFVPGEEYIFLAGGSITIMGGVPDASIPNGTTLLTGFNVSGEFDLAHGNIALIVGPDEKNARLLAYFGLPIDQPFAFSGSIHTMDLVGGTGGSFSAGGSGSTDVQNTAVPEPATMLLLGSGLIGLAGFARRKLKI